MPRELNRPLPELWRVGSWDLNIPPGRLSSPKAECPSNRGKLNRRRDRQLPRPRRPLRHPLQRRRHRPHPPSQPRPTPRREQPRRPSPHRLRQPTQHRRRVLRPRRRHRSHRRIATARQPPHATMTITTMTITTTPSPRTHPHQTCRRRGHPAWRATVAVDVDAVGGVGASLDAPGRHRRPVPDGLTSSEQSELADLHFRESRGGTTRCRRGDLYLDPTRFSPGGVRGGRVRPGGPSDVSEPRPPSTYPPRNRPPSPNFSGVLVPDWKSVCVRPAPRGLDPLVLDLARRPTGDRVRPDWRLRPPVLVVRSALLPRAQRRGPSTESC
jgi:hypothetical protein